MSTQENLPQVFEDDSIDLVALLKQIYQGRKLIILSAVIAAILGAVVALATPNTYTSGATFIPQTGGDVKTPSGLSGLASLAGINLSSMGGGSEIPPTLYPQIVSSVPYRMELMDSPVSKDSGQTLRDYLNENYIEHNGAIGLLKKYTIGLPGAILKALRGSSEAMSNDGGIFQISEEDKALFELLSDKLTLALNEKEGFVTLQFSDEDKFVAAQVAERAKELLQERIIAFKNQSARELLEFTTKQYQENKTSYEALQDSIAIFKDQNLNISSSLYQNRLDRLERELNIASSVVEQLASQVEQAKLQVNKDTPVFTIIEPVTVPFERSAPKRSLIVVIWTFLGVVLSTGFVLVKDPAKEIIASIRE
jgi:uncharacterized protein involved in exopolysaccharide biosynthesis